MAALARIAPTAGASAAAGVAATVLNTRQAEKRRLRRGEDVPFGSVHSRMQKVGSVGGVRINVEVDEPGGGADRALPTLVFVHGIVCSIDAWHYQRLALRGRFRMVFMDHRSHGQSDASDRAGSTIENLAADLSAVLEATTEGPVVLVGHSMGGMTIMQLAADRPELFEGDDARVAGVVLLNTSSRLTLVSSPALRRLVPVARGLGPVVDWGRGFNSFRALQRWALGPNAQERHVDMTNEMVLKAPTRVLTDFHPMFSTMDLAHGLQTLGHVPTTVVASTHDAITPLSHGRRIAEGIPGSSLVILEDTGHMGMFEQHARVTEIVSGLAEKVAA